MFGRTIASTQVDTDMVQKETSSVPPGLPGHGLQKAESKEISMQDLLLKIRNVNNNIDHKFEVLQEEINALKADMVSKVEFEDIVSRVKKLEETSISNQVSLLKQQLTRLDPTNKSVCINGFKEVDLTKRAACIDQLLSSHFGVQARSIDHIYLGQGTDRKLSQISIVELSNRSIREEVYKKADTLALGTLKDDAGGILKINRAKTNLQLQRNASLKKALTLIKNHAASHKMEVKINWKIEQSKDRSVTAGGTTAFSQSPQDIQGNFFGPWEDLHF